MFKYKRIYILFFIIIITLLVVSFGIADTAVLRTDGNRGPWMDTVDEGARGYIRDEVNVELNEGS